MDKTPTDKTFIDRATRHLAKTTISSKDSSLIINDKDFIIYDFSESGISCFLPIDENNINLGIFSISDADNVDLNEGKIANITFRVNDSIVFQGEGQIVRREILSDGKKLALNIKTRKNTRIVDL